jgi:alpha-ketoglutarate-dependent taurine dioxygenase
MSQLAFEQTPSSSASPSSSSFNSLLLNNLPEGISVHPIAGRIGAEVRGIKLSADLPHHLQEIVRTAWLKYKVVFFRDQDHVTDESQEALAQIFGETSVAHPTARIKEGTSVILELDSQHGGRADSWHTDVTFVPDYPKASILRNIVAPDAGGATVWANTHAAYEELPPALQQLAESLWSVHSNEYDYAVRKVNVNAEALRKYREEFTSTIYETEHPLVHIHPDTQEKSLILGHFFKRFVGLSQRDSQQLFQLFQERITSQENTVRWNWQPHDIAIWDNRATQHYAVNDYGDAHRVVRRVTVKGDIPISVDGQHSRLLKREPNPAQLKAAV